MMNEQQDKKKNKNVFYGKARLFDIRIGETMSVILNEQAAWNHGVRAIDKVWLIYNDGSEAVVNADLSTTLVKVWEIGITKDVYEKYDIKEWDLIGIYFTRRSNISVEAIRKKMRWEDINYDEIYAIIKDISVNKLTDTLMTYYVASSFFNETSNEEMYLTAKAMAETWVTFKYPEWEIVADKHCIGWVPGNETTMIIIPTLASLWVKMPKNFSKAITSPAATWECVDVLMDISFDKKGIKNLIEKNNCCLVWWWSLDLAPADDKIIRVSYPLSMQNIAKVVSSIMAKKYAMGITHSLVDIPVWPTAKVPNMEVAKEWKEKFEYVGEKLWMKMSVQITEAKEPIWNWVWAVMQVREVLRILQQHDKRPIDLEKKAMFLSSKIIEIAGLAKWKEALDLAYKQLRSGASWKMMQKIIEVQNGKNKDVKSEELELWTVKREIKSEMDWVVKSIDMKYLNAVARTLWCPIENEAGLYLSKKLWDSVATWEVIYTLYANDENKMVMALEMLDGKKIYEF